jgi:hypothetical protein
MYICCTCYLGKYINNKCIGKVLDDVTKKTGENISEVGTIFKKKKYYF